jgi:hypothetical protein
MRWQKKIRFLITVLSKKLSSRATVHANDAWNKNQKQKPVRKAYKKSPEELEGDDI